MEGAVQPAARGMAGGESSPAGGIPALGSCRIQQARGIPSCSSVTSYSQGGGRAPLRFRLEHDRAARDLDRHLSPDCASHASGVLATEQVLEAHTSNFVPVWIPGAVDEKCLTQYVRFKCLKHQRSRFLPRAAWLASRSYCVSLSAPASTPRSSHRRRARRTPEAPSSGSRSRANMGGQQPSFWSSTGTRTRPRKSEPPPPASSTSMRTSSLARPAWRPSRRHRVVRSAG